MPSSLKLRNHFHHKEFEFIYICLHSTKDNWEKIIKRLKIDGKHYYLNKEESDIFAAKIIFRLI